MEVGNFSQADSIESSNREVIVSANFEISISTRKVQASARWNSILKPEEVTFSRQIAYPLT